MNRHRISDESTSVLPADEQDGHSHPLPRYARVALALHGAFIALLFILVLWLIAHLDATITEEMDRRTALRSAQQQRLEAEVEAQRQKVEQQLAEQERATILAVCRVLPDLPQTPNVRDLATTLRCP